MHSRLTKRKTRAKGDPGVRAMACRMRHLQPSSSRSPSLLGGTSPNRLREPVPVRSPHLPRKRPLFRLLLRVPIRNLRGMRQCRRILRLKRIQRRSPTLPPNPTRPRKPSALCPQVERLLPHHAIRSPRPIRPTVRLRRHRLRLCPLSLTPKHTPPPQHAPPPPSASATEGA